MGSPSPRKKKVWTASSQLGSLGLADWAVRSIQDSIRAAADILKARYGQPPPGTYIQEGDRIIWRQPAGAGPLVFPGIGVGASGIPLSWLIILAGILIIVLAARR